MTLVKINKCKEFIVFLNVIQLYKHDSNFGVIRGGIRNIGIPKNLALPSLFFGETLDEKGQLNCQEALQVTETHHLR